MINILEKYNRLTDEEITEGDTIDLKQGITARDEIDGNLEIVVEGEVDTNKVGEYEIKVKATDNNTEVTYKVKVNAKPEEVSESTTTQSNQSTQSTTNKSNNSTTNKTINSNTSSTNNKTTANSNASNQANKTTESTSDKTELPDEPTTYTGETDENKYSFQDRGEGGNYGEKFTW